MICRVLFQTLFMKLTKKKAIFLAEKLMEHLESEEVDAFKYGLDFSSRLDLLGEKENAKKARELYQKSMAIDVLYWDQKNFNQQVSLQTICRAESYSGSTARSVPPTSTGPVGKEQPKESDVSEIKHAKRELVHDSSKKPCRTKVFLL